MAERKYKSTGFGPRIYGISQVIHCGPSDETPDQARKMVELTLKLSDIEVTEENLTPTVELDRKDKKSA